MSSRVGSQLLLVAALVASAATAVADTRVVLVDAPQARLPSLEAQLGLHLSRSIAIVGVAGQPTDVAALAAMASGLLVEHAASLVVWVRASDLAGDDQMFVVYVTGHRPDRAVVELVRLPARTPASEVERTIALKLASLLDTLITTTAGVVVGVPPAVHAWNLRVGASATIDRRDRGLAAGPELAVEHVRSLGEAQLAVQVAVRWQLAAAIDRPIARMTIHEVAGLIGTSLQHRWRRVTAVGGVHAGAGWFRARGEHPAGREGAADAWVPIVGAGVGARLQLWGATSVSLSAGLDRLLIRQRFVVDGQPVVDLGRQRVGLGLGLATSW